MARRSGEKRRRASAEQQLLRAPWLSRGCLHGRYAGPELKADKVLVLAAVRRCGRALRHAAAPLRANRVVAMVAVSDDGAALRHAAAHLRADREVAIAAVRQYGRALAYVEGSLRDDREVVMAAVGQDAQALQFAGAALRAELQPAATGLHALSADPGAAQGDALSTPAQREAAAESRVSAAPLEAARDKRQRLCDD
eukprot:6396590-Prymnesium_polylepis.1